MLRTTARLLIFLLLFPVASFATTYNYTGPYYPAGEITSSGTPAYTSSMRITGSITTANPLPANLNNADISGSGLALIQSYSFNDGLHTYDGSNSHMQNFKVYTDAQGQITGFIFSFLSPKPNYSIGELVNLISVDSTSALVGSQIPCETTSCSATVAAPPGVSAVYMHGAGYDPGAFVSSPLPSAFNATAPALSRSGIALLAALLALAGIAAQQRRIIARTR